MSLSTGMERGRPEYIKKKCVMRGSAVTSSSCFTVNRGKLPNINGRNRVTERCDVMCLTDNLFLYMGKRLIYQFSHENLIQELYFRNPFIKTSLSQHPLSVLIDFAGYLMPQSAAAADIEISERGGSLIDGSRMDGRSIIDIIIY
ncbi:MAG: hypothetical protein ACOX8E_13400 [Ruminococcus sp.]|jgi:hypothetical protein